MGCHTWTYVKVKSLTTEQNKRYLDNARKKINEEMNDIKSCSEKDIERYIKGCQHYYEQEQKEIEDLKKEIGINITQEEFESIVEEQLSFFKNYNDREFCIADYNRRYEKKQTRLKRLNEATSVLDVIDILEHMYWTLVEEHFGEYYVATDDVIEGGDDALFRIGSYPEDVFTNPDELIEWLHKNYEDSLYYYNGPEDNWKKHVGVDETVIKKIKDFWSNNKDNELLIRFG